MNAEVLVLDDEINIRKIVSAMLEAEGYVVHSVGTITQAKEIIKQGRVEAVLCDLRLTREDGLQLLKWVREEQSSLPVIILTAHGSIDSAVDAMKQGAFDYLSKPFDRIELARVIKKAVLSFKVQSEELKNWNSSESPHPMIGETPKMLKLYGMLDKVASSDSTVLILGESGTGKELIAGAIHERSSRAKGPFIKINCAAIAENLMESELFGHERGAFTGAISSKPGRFELADNGTLFLDEIAEMSVEMQVKLLRVLQEKSFERVGGVRTLNVDVRLIAATNRDLDKEIREGRFRNDLFYRLNVVPLELPPLRERPEDIPRLIVFFLKKMGDRMKKDPPVLQPETLELLVQYPWPGNIRQLENVIERVMVLNGGGAVTAEQLPEEILEFEEQRFVERQATSAGSLKELVKDATRRIEKKAIEEALQETQNNVTQAARRLNISRKGLQLKMKELGIR
ncbi:MAG: sigma-54-dependent Fis family transcriptional regulator [Deltaproteobacteria bacterium]|nr:sigma-54-dependent Fis family transcriptional regulator [Deltaproteobacteria bacterium]